MYVSTDLFELYGRSYTYLVDPYSGYMEEKELSDTSTYAVVKMLKANLSRYDIMNTLIYPVIDFNQQSLIQ